MMRGNVVFDGWLIVLWGIRLNHFFSFIRDCFVTKNRLDSFALILSGMRRDKNHCFFTLFFDLIKR